MTKMTRWSVILPALVLLCGVAAGRAAEPVPGDAKAKPKTTPPTITATPGPASTRARVPTVDLYPVSVELVRRDGTTPCVRVSYQCEASQPLNIGVTVEIRTVSSGGTPSTTNDPVAPCAARQTGEMCLYHLGGRLMARVDPYGRVTETNEGNNTCNFDSASFATSTRVSCR